MDRERSYNPRQEPPGQEPRLRRAWKHSRLAGPVAGLVVGAAASLASGAFAERSGSSSQAKAPDIPERPAPPDVSFYGERERYVELFYASYALADEYWRSLGHGPSSCEEGMDVIYTLRFAGYEDRERERLPSGAIECHRRRIWSNKDIAADPWQMSRFLAHELGHARGFRHTGDPDSIMYSKDLERTSGKQPPAAATVERFARLFEARTGS